MDVVSAALSGLDQAQGQFEQSVKQLIGAAGAPSGSGLASGDIVELSQAAVSLIAAKDQVALNLKVVKMSEDMEKSAINMLA